MKNTTRHIVLLTLGFPENENDTTNIPALQVYVRGLTESNPELNIQIITFQFPFTSTNYHWHGIPVFPLNGKNNKLKKLWVWQKALRLLKQFHKTQPIDCIHSFWIGECAFIGEIFSRKNQIKHIITAMGQDVLKPNRYAISLYKTKSTIISLSNSHHHFLAQNHGINSQIIPWGIAANEFPAIQEKTIDILGVGSLNEVKNYTLFIQIIAKLKTQQKHLKVVLIGDGKLKRQIEHEIIKNKLQDVVTLTGELPRDQVLDKMAKAKILLHPSTFESFGYVFSEALYSGMQIVSFNVGTATAIREWAICNNQQELISCCDMMLKQYSKEKQRIILHPETGTVMRYLKLYYSK